MVITSERGVTSILQWVLQGCYRGYAGCYRGLAGASQGFFRGITGVLQGYYRGITGVLQGYSSGRWGITGVLITFAYFCLLFYRLNRPKD